MLTCAEQRACRTDQGLVLVVYTDFYLSIYLAFVPWVQCVLVPRKKAAGHFKTSKASVPDLFKDSQAEPQGSQSASSGRRPGSSVGVLQDQATGHSILGSLWRRGPDFHPSFHEGNQFIDTEGQVRNLRVAHKDTISVSKHMCWIPSFSSTVSFATKQHLSDY